MSILLLLEIIALATVEGITEFLPISSTGHLILMEKLLPNLQHLTAPSFVTTLDFTIQGSAILAVAITYRHKLYKETQNLAVGAFLVIMRHPSQERTTHRSKSQNLIIQMVVSFMPIGIIALIVDHSIGLQSIMTPRFVVFGFVAGGIMLIVLDTSSSSSNVKISQINHISLKQCLVVGCFQAMSLIPGMSRSAMAICGCLALKSDRRTAAEFSILLGMPTLAINSVYHLLKNFNSLSAELGTYLLSGCLTSLISAAVSIKILLKLMPKINLYWFGVYRILFAIIIATEFTAAEITPHANEKA